MMAQSLRFKNKVVIVTGAAQGIGEGVAIALAKEGAKVVLADRSDLIDDVAKKLGKLKTKSLTVKVDLETYAGATKLISETVKAFKKIDVIINNVGGTIWAKPYENYDEDQIEAEIRRSLFPTLWCCRAVLPVMIKQQHGVVVNISSIATRSIHRIPCLLYTSDAADE